MAKNLFRGQTTVNNIYRGNTSLSKVYRGQDVVWTAAEPAPPVTADVYDFRASSYSGTGDWIDEVAGYGADLLGSPTFVSNGLSSYWELNGSSAFSVPRAELPDNLFDTMGSPTSGITEGAFEFVVYADTWTGKNLATMWNSPDATRMFIIGNSSSTSLGTLFATENFSTAARSYKTHTGITLNTGQWLHIIVDFSMADNYIDLYINGTSVSSLTWTSTTQVWNGADVCLALGLRQDNCGGSTNYWDGKYAVARGYNDKLGSSNVSSLYSYWSTYYS